jgi:hypothetical protein
MDAVHLVSFLRGLVNDLMHEIGVTVEAVFVQNFTIVFTYKNGFVKILQGKLFGMLIPVFRLGEPF